MTLSLNLALLASYIVETKAQCMYSMASVEASSSVVMQHTLLTRTRHGSSTGLASIVSCSYLWSIICVCIPDQKLSVVPQAE